MVALASRSLTEIAAEYAAPGLLLRARIEGLPPGLLMHNPDAMRTQEEAARAHKAAGRKTKFIPTAEEEAEWGAYRLSSGSLYLPTRMLKRCCVEAGKAFKKDKSRASMFMDIAAGMTFPPSVGLGSPLLDPETGELLTKYVVNTQRAVVARQGIQRSRPLLEQWALETELSLDPDPVPPDVFAQIFGYAGARQGLGDLRPEKGGEYGRFRVVMLEVI
jgi:hypothetical protein